MYFEELRILVNAPMKRNKMGFSSDIAWPQCSLGSGEQFLPNGSLNCNTIFQLELFCEMGGKWSEVSYIQAFITLHQRGTIQRKCNMHTIMIQKNSFQ